MISTSELLVCHTQILSLLHVCITGVFLETAVKMMSGPAAKICLVSMSDAWFTFFFHYPSYNGRIWVGAEFLSVA